MCANPRGPPDPSTSACGSLPTMRELIGCGRRSLKSTTGSLDQLTHNAPTTAARGSASTHSASDGSTINVAA